FFFFYHFPHKSKKQFDVIFNCLYFECTIFQFTYFYISVQFFNS
ncbi:unnamed protein product, partial [Tenebrio molitor]